MAQTLPADDFDMNAETLTSLTGKVWRFRNYNERLAQSLAQEHKLEPLVAAVLAGRNIPQEKIGAFLEPKLRDFLPDPFVFLDMDKAANRIADAVQNKEKVALFGDYDVDGATSTALMTRFLRHFGLDPTIHIPDRLLEGYGPNVPAFQQFVNDKHTLIITLDCGVVAYDPLRVASENNVDVVVLDHHMGAPELPQATAIVNPNRLDEKAGYTYMAAVGVTFVTLIAVCQILRQRNIDVPDLREWLDLVALGTVCDVVPVVDLNRAFVAQGLKIMGYRNNQGLRALADVVGLDQTPTSYHAGFMLGPRINAGGRIASSTLGVRLLSSTCPHDTLQIAQQLDDLNKERQAIEKHSVEEAMGMVAREPEKFSHIIVLASRDWHPGVIGLIAARVKEQYQRPTCALAIDENGKAKASGRSIGGFDLGALVLKARMEGFVKEGGGHAMAAGFSLAENDIPALHEFFHGEMLKQYGDALPAPEIAIDARLALNAIQMPVVKQLQMLEPFGPGNAAPKLLLSPVRLQRVDVVKEKHLRLNVSDMAGQQRVGIMMFNQGSTPLHQKLSNISPYQQIALLGTLKLSTWQGRDQAQFIADDIALLEDANG